MNPFRSDYPEYDHVVNEAMHLASDEDLAQHLGNEADRILGTKEAFAEGQPLNIKDLLEDFLSATLDQVLDSGNPGLIEYYLDLAHEYNLPFILNSALQKASSNGNVPLMDRVYKMYHPKNLGLPLHLAIEKGHLPAVRYLIEHGANDVNRDLREASYNGHLDLVLYFLDRGATDLNGALYLASNGGHLDVVEELLRRGATDTPGALMGAITGNHLDLVKYWVEHRVRHITTPLNVYDYARFWKDSSVYNYLKQQGLIE